MAVLFPKLADENYRAVQLHADAFGHAHESAQLLVFISARGFDQLVIVENQKIQTAARFHSTRYAVSRDSQEP